MFVRNATSWQPVLARGNLTQDAAVLSLNVDLVVRFGTRGDAEFAPDAPRAKSDPPDTRLRCQWEGVSVTATGDVLGPCRAPYMRAVSVTVGGVERKLLVFGERVWRRTLTGQTVATEPAPFDRVTVDWAHAFGGRHVLPPGYQPGTELPHPGGTVALPLNPGGMGWYPLERLAIDQPLPRIEDAREPVRAWHDWPAPVGIAPCPDHVVLRLQGAAKRRAVMPSLLAPEEAMPGGAGLSTILGFLHYAPPDLIFPDVPPGTPVRVDGLGTGSVVLAVAPSPIAVTAVRGRSTVDIPGKLRAIHIDSERRIARFSYGHELSYSRRVSPYWVEVRDTGRTGGAA